MSFSYRIQVMDAKERLYEGLVFAESEQKYIYAGLVISGDGPFKINDDKEGEHNFYAVLDAFYEYYNAPDHRFTNIIPITIEKGIEKAISTAITYTSYNNIVNFITLQMKRERKNEAPFHIDSIKLLRELKDEINRRKEIRDMLDKTETNWLERRYKEVENTFQINI